MALSSDLVPTLLAKLESAAAEEERGQALEELAALGTSDACRALIEALQRSVWRSTKTAIIRALGRMRQQRGTELLLRIAADPDDLALALEAVLALGATEDAVAGEFLLNLLVQGDHPLRREAIIALTEMHFFPCVDALVSLLESPEAHHPSAVVQYSLLGLARLGRASEWPVVLRYLVPDRSDDGGPIFNAALLAAGELGQAAAIPVLEALDTRYRFFAHHLKLAAMARIRERLRRGLEDVVSELMTAPSSNAQRYAALALRHFTLGSAWEACELLASDAPPSLKALMRVVLFRAETAEQDLEFLADNAAAIDHDTASMLLRLHASKSGASFSERLFARVPRSAAIAWMARVKDRASLARLNAILIDPFTPILDQGLAINAMVAQAQMAGKGAPETLECGNLLVAQIEVRPQGPVRLRLIRALGQIGYGERTALVALERWLKQGDAAAPSICHTLSALGGEGAARILLRRLRALGDRESEQTQLVHAMAALARLGRLPDTEPIRKHRKVAHERVRAPLLQILASNPIEGFEIFVKEAIASRDFQLQMLGVAAARFNHNEDIWQGVFACLEGTSLSLAERALDSLCVGGGVHEHHQLLRYLTPEGERGRVLKILRTVAPRPDADYRPFVSHLDQQLELEAGVFADKEVIGSALHLRDRLVFSHGRPPLTLPPVAASKTALHIHEIDRSLSALLPGYARYSELVRSALRNAELTFHHSEIFDGSVDKSTMVVEYVKSIDLFLQERIGAQIFFGGESKVLRNMQSRVVFLELDNESQATERLVDDLDCRSHFSSDDFPAHKLTTISRAILSGKILHDQHRTLDGARAWALMLLVFARRFRFRVFTMQPLFDMKTPDNRRVCAMAADLNSLQELRNTAAHRGTMLRSQDLLELRDYSLGVLRELDRALS